MGDLSKITPPKDLSQADLTAIFSHICRRLAQYRNTAELYAQIEYGLSTLGEQRKATTRDNFIEEIDRWAQELLKEVWFACKEPGGGTA